MSENISKFKIQLICIYGFILRIIFGLKSVPQHNQHDMLAINGHFDYALYLFRYHSLPLTNSNQMYHPPLNAIIQSIFMKFISIFVVPDRSIEKVFNLYRNGKYSIDIEKDVTLYNYLLNLFSYVKFLSIIWSCLILIFIYKILKEVNIKNDVKFFILTLLSTYPGMIIMAGQFNNEPLAYVFLFASIYYFIKWCKCRKISSIIKLSIVISFGILSKISVSIIFFVIAPAFLYFLIKDYKTNFKNLFFQMSIFSVIILCFGCLFVYRNYLIFGQSINFIPETGISLDTSSHNMIERVFSFPIDRLKVKKYNIFHDAKEYNIWIDLLKTSTFEEFRYGIPNYYFACNIMFVCNIIFYILSLCSFFVSFFKNKTENKYFIMLLQCLVAIAIISYFLFNLKYPRSCTSNYRYIMYITFSLSSILFLMINKITNIKIKKIINNIISIYLLIFLLSTSIFVVMY